MRRNPVGRGVEMGDEEGEERIGEDRREEGRRGGGQWWMRGIMG